MNFPASTNAGQAQPGPAYGCLGSQPNPAWFFFQIQSAGSVSIAMSANFDIDFICWGPFNNLASACSNLTAPNIQSCSFSASATETCTIANAIPGAFYMLLITNFQNQVQNITFNQINANQPGAASTNCGFVCAVTATNTGMVCAGGSPTLMLGAQSSSAVTSYTWMGPNSFNVSAPAVVLSNIQSSGVYTLMGTANATLNGTPYSGTCQSTTSVTVVQYPSFSITPNFTNICQGGNFNASVNFLTPPSSACTFSWFPNNAGIMQPQAQATNIAPNLLPVTTTLAQVYYGVTVTPTVMNCPFTNTMFVTISNPMTPTLSLPGPQCDINGLIQLAAAPGGGTWSANPAVNPSGLFNCQLAPAPVNLVTYAVQVGTCVVANSGTIEVSKFHTSALTANLSRCVQDAPFNLMNIVQDPTTGSWSGPGLINGTYFDPSGMATGNYSLTYVSTSSPNPLSCPSQTTLVIPVFNPPVPVINNILPRCTTSGTVQLTATPGGGTWTGNSGVSFSGIQNPVNNSIGYNLVSYSAGQGTCIATSSRTFEVSQFVPASITGTVQPMCVTNGPFNLMSIVQSSTGGWSGPGTGGTSFSPAGLQTGLYTLTYSTASVPNTSLCPDFKTLVVSVLNPPTPTIIPIGPVCSQDAALQLTVSPNSGYWVTTAYLQSNGVFTPSLSAIGSNLVQYVTGTPTCNVKQSINVNTEQFIPATIVRKIPDLCTSNPAVNLGPMSANTLGAWSGPGVIGSNFSPVSAGAGSHKLVYKTASSPSNLCPDSDTLSVRVYSLDVPTIMSAGPICNNTKPFHMQVSPLGGVFGGPQPKTIDNAGLFNPASAVIGKNLVTYSITNGPCIAYAQTTVEVEKFVSAQLSRLPSPAICVNQEPFDMNAYVIELGGVWTGPGMLGSSMFFPAKALVGSSNVLYYHTRSANNALLCPDVSSVQILVKDLPKASISSTSLTGCVPLTVNFNSRENKTGKGTWMFGDGSTNGDGFTGTHTYTGSGVFDVFYKYEDTDAPGCTTMVKLNVPVKVLENPKAAFSVYPDEIFTSDATAKITNLTPRVGDNSYQWMVQNVGTFSSINPTVTFPKAGIYRITMVASNPVTGCKSEVSGFVEVKNDINCFIPNSFTPDYDGLNDRFFPVFSPFGLDPKSYLLEIYNRWGQLIFSSTDHTEGWDGTFRNYGEGVLQQDSYNYQLTYKDLEGRKYQRNGLVMLLR